MLQTTTGLRPVVSDHNRSAEHFRQHLQQIKSTMSVHNVLFTLPERELGKTDIEFVVKKNGSKFGTLKVSKGAVVWVPKDYTFGYKIGWRDLGDFFEERGTKES